MNESNCIGSSPLSGELPPVPNPHANYSCHYCQERDHIARNCPKKKKKAATRGYMPGKGHGDQSMGRDVILKNLIRPIGLERKFKRYVYAVMKWTGKTALMMTHRYALTPKKSRFGCLWTLLPPQFGLIKDGSRIVVGRLLPTIQKHRVRTDKNWMSLGEVALFSSYGAQYFQRRFA
eukprot:IDg20989t1